MQLVTELMVNTPKN